MPHYLTRHLEALRDIPHGSEFVRKGEPFSATDADAEYYLERGFVKEVAKAAELAKSAAPAPTPKGPAKAPAPAPRAAPTQTPSPAPAKAPAASATPAQAPAKAPVGPVTTQTVSGAAVSPVEVTKTDDGEKV